MKRNALVHQTPAKRIKTIDTRSVKSKNNRFRGLKKGDNNAVEYKVFDVAATNYNADTTGSITLINGIAEGTGLSQRIGRIVNWTSVQIRGILQPVDGQTDATYCRVLVVWDSDPNGAAPTMTDIFTASTSLSYNNLNNRDRFRIIADESHAIGGTRDASGTAIAQSPTVMTIDRYVSLPKLQTVFQGALGPIANIQHGAMWLVTIGDRAVGNGGTFSLACRTRYVDP